MDMTKVALLLVLVLLAASCVVTFLPVKAEVKTIIVPYDYSTIREAINAANDGYIILVKKGTYEEKTLRIDKAISLKGEDPEYTKINLDPPLYQTDPDFSWWSKSYYASAITVDANDFKLSGFTIDTPNVANIPGGAISITGNRTQIIDNKITPLLSVNGSYANIEENTLSDGVGLYGSYCQISANNIDGSGSIHCRGSYNSVNANNVAGRNNWGINVEGAFCLVHGNKVTDSNSVCIYVRSNGTIVGKNSVDSCRTGMDITGSNNVVYGNLITNCGVQPKVFAPDIESSQGEGIRVTGSNIIYANYVAKNVVGARIYRHNRTNLTSTLYHNNFIDNTFQVSTRYILYGSDSFDNGKEGNYWSDYTGEDANGNGIGDIPYIIDEARSDRYPLMVPFDIDSVQLDLSGWMSPSLIDLISPINTTYVLTDIAFVFTVSKQTSWLSYSLDGEANVTITGNITLPKLSYGSHKIQVYATDLVGHNSTSETIYFTIAEEPEPFPTALVVASIASVVIIGAGVVLYFAKSRKHPRKPSNQPCNSTTGNSRKNQAA
jgi:nitrous oxidase accessory protein NosD